MENVTMLLSKNVNLKFESKSQHTAKYPQYLFVVIKERKSKV